MFTGRLLPQHSGNGGKRGVGKIWEKWKGGLRITRPPHWKLTSFLYLRWLFLNLFLLQPNSCVVIAGVGASGWISSIQ